jgi:phenylpropionate dioxygenase-like ring-hydroxylating dioxygenase large terminal subunit
MKSEARNSEFLSHCWYMVAWGRDISSAPTPLMLLNDPIVAYRTADGAVVVLEDRCPHKLAPLSLGQVEGADLRCGYHGLKFAPDGRCIEVPGQDSIPAVMRVRAYAVVEAHSAIWVWPGAPEYADPALIPPFGGLDDPEWRMMGSQMDYEANYTLINENLLDLSHVAFVHRNSFGAGEKRAADPKSNIAFAPRKTEKLSRGLRFTRIVESAPTNPLLREWIDPVSDVWSVVTYLAPGIFLLNADTYKAGSIARAGGNRPPDDQYLHRSSSCQAVTPMTDRTSRYFYAMGRWARNAASVEAMFELTQTAFLEDNVVLTAQQRVIDNSPDAKPMLLPSDREGVEFSRIMNRLMQEEQDQLALA